MRGVRTGNREDWVSRVLGPHHNFTVGNVLRAFRSQAKRGWLTAMVADGPVYEQVVMIHVGHPFATILKRYVEGVRWFDRDAVEAAVGKDVSTLRGARILAKLGFGIRQIDGSQLELAACDTAQARFVNESRCTRQLRGYAVRQVVAAMLHIQRPGTRRINLSIDRRLHAYYALLNQWFIQGNDLLLEHRHRVRLASHWVFKQANPIQRVEFPGKAGVAVRESTWSRVTTPA